jgi:hypothetical protein
MLVVSASHFLQVGIVRIMTLDAIITGIMIIRVNRRHISPVALRIRQEGMAAQAEKPAGFYRQKFGIFRVINCRAMAIFAFKQTVVRRKVGFNIVFMTFTTIFLASIFYFKAFPFLNITQAMVPISEILTVYSKIVRNVYQSRNEQQDYAGYRKKKRPPDMVFHAKLLCHFIRVSLAYLP